MTKLTDHERLLLTMVAEEFNITFDDLFTRTQKREICEVRQVGMYFIVKRNIKRTNHALYTQVGQLFKTDTNIGYDHCSVIHAFKHVGQLSQTDKKFSAKLSELDARIFPDAKIRSAEDLYNELIGSDTPTKEQIIEFAIKYKNHCYYEQI